MRDTAFIQNWINAVALYKDTPNTTDSKTTGKRAYPSPEPDEMSDLTPERTKKRKTASRDDDHEIEDLDAEKTPRALLIPSRPAPSPSPSPTKSSASIRSASLRSSSQASSSRASSSRRKLSNLSLVEHGVQRQQLNGPDTPNLPQPIVDALKTIQRLERGKHVFASTLDRSRFTSLLDVNDLDDRAFATDRDVGSHLSPEDVDEILADAERCFKMDHDEGVWNVEVHQYLLKKVLRRSGSSHLVDFTLCTTAPIIRDYLPPRTAEKRVDFCFFIDPSCDPSYKPRIETLVKSLPEMSISHTSYGPLRVRPTTVSLETKRPGNDFDGAILQISVWQSAHWVMLRSLLGRTWPGKQACGLSRKDYANKSLRELGALHGIVIQGHDWIYVATSPEFVNEEGRESTRTQLWLYEPIGRTNTAFGVHKVSAFLEFLKTWSLQTYWPWYKRYFLDDIGTVLSSDPIATSVGS
ncbi:hypothetical protein Forpe1208_v016565 [Fusarium oxysporum f. sp. rapae]|uniref:PD-(D/E)XK nuclease-like domain-containing protein n=1 Tax=Fusarium oxysporum f. sp. rapae TaxID=485398 RepID=A0A8J5NDV2_FUSOX|nr:hypothetical protein Forpe1208_v016565 [Fusarium oxysporum f. sp. rapae]